MEKQEKKYGLLTKEEYDFYWENGYFVGSQLFSDDECNEILALFKKYANADFAAIMNIDRHVPRARMIMRDPRIAERLEAFQQKEVVGLMSQILFKEAGSLYAPQAWNPHQDNAYPQSEDGAYITINLFLNDADKENGTLYVFPGSHKEGLQPATPTPSYREIPGTNPGNTVAVPEKYERVDVNFKKGDVLFLHGNCVHGSYPNVSVRSRPLFSISYITKGVPFISGRNAKRTEISLH